MRNAILISLIGVILISLLTIGAAYAMPQDAMEPAESISAASSGPGKYLLKAYQGKLAVFTEDLVNPDTVFEVYVRTLPPRDIDMLEKGVRVGSMEELNRLVEDYIS